MATQADAFAVGVQFPSARIGAAPWSGCHVGNDNHNTAVTFDEPGHQRYADIRTSIALPRNAIISDRTVRAALGATGQPTLPGLPASNPGGQLQIVARLIAARQAPGVKRQVFSSQQAASIRTATWSKDTPFLWQTWVSRCRPSTRPR